MTTFNWQIVQMDRLASDGFIFTAHWTATAVNEEYSASVYNTCTFAAATPTIPYANVTMQEVLGWCWTNGVDKDAIEANLAQQIELQKSPVNATGVPW